MEVTNRENSGNGKSNSKEFILKLPDGVLLSIFTFTIKQVSDVSRVNLVCKRFNDLCQNEMIWRSLSNEAMAKLKFEKFNANELYWVSPFHPQVIRDQLSLREIKSILAKCKISFSDFIEKSEFCAALIEANETLLKERWFKKNGLRSYLLNREKWGKWKISYVSLEIQKSRTYITLDEITSCSWLFLFKEDAGAFQSIGVCVYYWIFLFCLYHHGVVVQKHSH